MNRLDRLILRGKDPDAPASRLSFERLRWAAVLSVVILCAGFLFLLSTTANLARDTCKAFQEERQSTRAAYLLLASDADQDRATFTAGELRKLSGLITEPDC